MRKRSPLLGLSIAAVLAAGHPPAQTPGAPDLSKYVGVVDLLTVLNAYPKFVEGRAALKRMDDEFNAAREQDVQEIQQLELDILALEPGTREHRVKSLDLDLAKRRVNGLATVHGENRNAELARLNLDAYDDISKAVAKVAEAKGLKLVLRQRGDPPNANLPDELRFSANERRTVLFVAPELDLTADVINMLKAAREEDAR